MMEQWDQILIQVLLPPKPGSTAALARQANSGGIGAVLAGQKLQNMQNNKQPDTTTKVGAEESKPSSGANRSSTRGSRRSMLGSASSSFAGNVGSVNTEEQNDDVLLPYMKGNV